MANKNTISVENGIYSFHYQSEGFDTFIRDIENMFQISVMGVLPESAETIAISLSAESLEGLLKKCMASIGVESYAFKYRDAALTTLYIVPSSGEDIILTALPENTIDRQKGLGARVTSTADDADMQTVNLKTGDIIIEYDHIPISGGPLELTRLMEERSGSLLIEIRFFRDDIPVTAFVPGGYLNAGLKSVPLDDF